MTKTELLEGLRGILEEDQINLDEEALYDAAADRYKKYAKAKKVLDVPIPMAIVYPDTTDEVKKILQFCNNNGVNVIPRSGKTATEGGLENWKECTVVVDANRMKKIIKIDTYNMQATVQAGVQLQTLEDELRKLGYTTGHSPQSKPVAEFGGLVATRSIGQFSTLYGGIEDMVAGLECVFPDGHISRIKNVSRRAGGPDIRHIVIGNEGTLCYITEVTVKIFKFYPENNKFYGYLVKDIDTGIKVLREVVVNGFKPSVARVYSEEDARQHFYHFHKGKCVLLFMAEGPAGIVEATGAEIEKAVEKYQSGIIEPVDASLIEEWFNHLNWSQQDLDDERQSMIDNDRHDGFTTEVSADWETIPKIYYNVIERIKKEFPRVDDLTMLGGHSSHSYINGTNMYFVYNYNINCNPEDEMRIYHHPLQRIIVEETLKEGGSMCHHHGIGKYRNEWTKEEHGSAYYMLEKLKEAFDPNGIMNFGTIFPQEEGKKYQ
ncbi:FAD-binding oxidoreductase [[Clostridium] hylemonae]|uniref:FAD binding domain protein n=1 Tax=[Clostridium] hylemonae DSM 15053 TaxID=553973 RepID=C0BZ28_9FIRM|nr:FAD-binding oxidoreductase [[Clostridium] hylemonae]EEG75106.1 FAD binding domain protein [[Clostridium] hylemonae DSM 15053]QEK18448.1 putative FAD-linked oxidoreductase [[Clostridium] hylemonae DSM 15053]BDF05449.1 FAD-linked oxidoreductase [[Clostridium] hylemonae]